MDPVDTTESRCRWSNRSAIADVVIYIWAGLLMQYQDELEAEESKVAEEEPGCSDLDTDWARVARDADVSGSQARRRARGRGGRGGVWKK